MKSLDDNDLRRLGKLPHDPTEGLRFFPTNSLPSMKPTQSPVSTSSTRVAASTPAIGKSQPGPGPNTAPALPKRWPTLAERALALDSGGGRLRTGVAVLDRNTRGGFKPGVVILGGAPGAAKTTLATQIAANYARDSIPVTILAADEGADGILSRLGQSLGFDRDAIEAGEPDTKKQLAEELGNTFSCLTLVDAVDEGEAIEHAVAELLTRTMGKTGVLIVDSVQRVRASGTDDAGDLRLRANLVTDALKSAAAAGLIVIATSELNRGAYSERNAGHRPDDLAAFKESGGIEYGADLAVLLRCVPGEPDGTVDLSIAKNRWGKRTPLAGRLLQDPCRATLAEVDIRESAVQSPKRTAMDPQTRLLADKTMVRETLRAHPDGVRGVQTLCDLNHGVGKDRTRRALAALEDEGEVRRNGPESRPRLFLSASLPGLPQTSPQTPQSSYSAGLPGLRPPIRGQSRPQTSPADFAEPDREAQPPVASPPPATPPPTASLGTKSGPVEVEPLADDLDGICIGHLSKQGRRK